jgi:hypothetical protein
MRGKHWIYSLGDRQCIGHPQHAALQAIAAGLEDIYPDPVSQSAFAAIAEPLKAVEKQFAGWMPQSVN